MSACAARSLTPRTRPTLRSVMPSGYSLATSSAHVVRMLCSSSTASSIQRSTTRCAAVAARPGRRPDRPGGRPSSCRGRFRRRVVGRTSSPPLVAATSSSRWCLQLAQGQGRASCRHSARVVGRGIASIGSGVCFGAVKVGSVGCATDSAVLVAAEDGRPARVAPAREELAGARAFEVVAVAAAGVLGEAALEHVASSLERGELGVALGELGAELA